MCLAGGRGVYVCLLPSVLSVLHPQTTLLPSRAELVCQCVCGAELPHACKGVSQGANDDAPWSSHACAHPLGSGHAPQGGEWSVRGLAGAAWDLVSKQWGRVRWEGQRRPRGGRAGFQEGQGLCVYVRLGQGGQRPALLEARESTEMGQEPVTKEPDWPNKDLGLHLKAMESREGF